MNKQTERVLGTVIDYSVFGFLLFIYTLLDLPDWVLVLRFKLGVVPVTLPSIDVFVFYGYLAFKDFLFKNQSIGKKIFNLIIVDNKWEIPSRKTLLKRGLLMPLGYAKFVRNGFKLSVVEDWEIDVLKTRVIDKGLYEKLKSDCEGKYGDFKINMDILYSKARNENR